MDWEKVLTPMIWAKVLTGRLEASTSGFNTLLLFTFNNEFNIPRLYSSSKKTMRLIFPVFTLLLRLASLVSGQPSQASTIEALNVFSTTSCATPIYSMYYQNNQSSCYLDTSGAICEKYKMYGFNFSCGLTDMVREPLFHPHTNLKTFFLTLFPPSLSSSTILILSMKSNT